MTTDATDLAALIGSRICHDLISPLGAIGNGVELMMLSGSAVGPELTLISESVTNANARIRFFRVAYGAASEDQQIGQTEILGILADMTRGGRLIIDWRPTGDCPRREVKLAFLMLQCLEAALPYGGRVTVARADDGWHVAAEAQKLNVDPDLWSRISDGTGGPDPLTAAQVQFGLVPGELARLRRQPRLKITETAIQIGF
jgi:histidine phosphotransferase ChpT